VNRELAKKKTFYSFYQNNSVLLALILLIILATFVNKYFLTLTNIINILRQSSIIGIIAIGMTFVILSGGIDLSVGSVLALIGGVILTVQNFGSGIFLSIVIGILVGIFIGLINGLIITKAKIEPFIVTLGMMTIARSLILYYANGGSVNGSIMAYSNIANSRILYIPVPVWIFLIVYLIAYVILEKTPYGRYIYAVGGNEKATLYSGINVDKVKLFVYMFLGFTVSVAAMIESSQLNSISSSSTGTFYELDSIAAVIIGGTKLSGGRGKIFGTIVGVLILGVLANLMNLSNISPYLQGFVRGVIIIGAVLLQKKENK
jgi:ribose transport system permease protein